jgi:hypothetical protein
MRKFSSEERTLEKNPVLSGMLDGFGREVVLDYDAGIKGCEVDLVDIFVDSRLRLEDHTSLVQAFSSEMFLSASASLFLKGTATPLLSASKTLEMSVPGVKREVRFGESPNMRSAIKTHFLPFFSRSASSICLSPMRWRRSYPLEYYIIILAVSHGLLLWFLVI